MKTVPPGVERALYIVGVGPVILPLTNAPQLWSWFSYAGDATTTYQEVVSAFPGFNGHLFDQDPQSAQFIYMLGQAGPRMWEIEGILSDPVSGKTVYVDNMAGDVADRKPATGGPLAVQIYSDAGPEITVKYPTAQAFGSLIWKTT